MKDIIRTGFVKCAAPVILATLAWGSDAAAQEFTYNPPGQLTAGSGSGREDYTVYVPEMRYPIEVAPSYPNSQVWGNGGGSGPGGGQCDSVNYSYPWSDNYCESRSWEMPLCPSGKGHQGQDIRPSTCEKNVHWAVAAEAGEITQIGTYSVYLITDDGTQHRYLHLQKSTLAVSVGDRVTKGQRIGLVSNEFGGTPTTIHLHYDIQQNMAGLGTIYVPTYMSLVTCYQYLLGTPAEPCQLISATGETIIDDTSRCFQLRGSLQYWREVTTAGFENKLYWTYAFTSANPGSWASWNFDFEQAGEYEVQVYVVPEYASSSKAKYKVFHDGGSQELVVDQAAMGEEGWFSLGRFDFKEGAVGQRLEIYDNTGDDRGNEFKIMADAVRIVGEEVVTPEPDMGSDVRPDMGGMDAPDMKPSSTPDMGGVPGNNTPDPGNNTPGNNDPGGDGGDEKPSGPSSGSTSTSSCACSSVTKPSERSPWELVSLGLLGLIGVLRRRR